MVVKKSFAAELGPLRSLHAMVGVVAAATVIAGSFNFQSTYDYKIRAELPGYGQVADDEVIYLEQPEVIATRPKIKLPTVAPEPIVEPDILEIVEEEKQIEETVQQDQTQEVFTSSETGEGWEEDLTGDTGQGQVTQEAPPGPVVKEVEEPKEDEIFEVTEVQPEFPGGMGALMQYLTKNIKYPPRAQENNIQGTAVLRFMVDRDGSISQVAVQKALDPDCDKEAVRVVKNMPKWSPGKNQGKAVKCWFTLPVRFRLQ